MKTTNKLLAIILGLAMLLSVGVSASTGVEAAADGNLLKNPSFENGWEGWFARARDGGYTTVPDWTATSDEIYDLTSNERPERAGIYAYDESMTADASFGQNYIKFVSNCVDSILVQEVSGLKPGGRYKFSGWVNMADTKARSGLSIVCAYNDKNGNRLDQDAYGDESKGTEAYAYGMHTAAGQWSALGNVANVWKEVTATIELPAEAYGMAIGLISTDWGNYRSYDNFSLTDISNLIVDGGFENVTFAEGSKLGDSTSWAEPTNATITERYTTDAHSGNYAYKVNITTGNVDLNSQCVAVTAGEVYKLSFWMKVHPTADTEGNEKDWFLRSSLTLLFSTSAPWSSIGMTDNRIGRVVSTAQQSSADGWLQTVVYFKTPSETKGLKLMLSTGATESNDNVQRGYIAFDDVELTRELRTEEVFSIFSDAARTSKKDGDESFISYAGYDSAGNWDEKWADEWTAIQPYYVQKTVKTEAAVQPGETYYAAAMTRNADTALLFVLYAEGENGVRTLREIRLADAPNSTAPMGILHTDTEVEDATSETGVVMDGGITVPSDSGTYTLEAYLWDGVGGMKPLATKTVFQ